MSGYSPAVSVARSGVGWLPDRVSRMTLVRIRYYGSDGKVLFEDSTPRHVDLPR